MEKVAMEGVTMKKAMEIPMEKVAMTQVTMKRAAMAKAAMEASGMKKSKKVKRVSKIATGKRARATVFAGRKTKTRYGMTKKDLTKNKQGIIVSKKRSALAKQRWKGSNFKAWSDAVKKARQALGLTGFVIVGGKSKEGKALYAKAKSLLLA